MPGKAKKVRKAPKGTAAGMAAIRIMCNALETAMIERYVGNAPTLRGIRAAVSKALKEIARIRPAMMSDCEPGWKHKPNCVCWPPNF